MSGLILATANDEILIFVYHSVQRLEEKNWWNKILNYNSWSFCTQVPMVYWGRYLALTLETRVQFPAQYFLFFSTFTLFCPFLEILKGQKRGAYTARPHGTRPHGTLFSQIHYFGLSGKISEIHYFSSSLLTSRYTISRNV